MLLDKSYIKLFFISEGLCFPQEHGNVVNLEKSVTQNRIFAPFSLFQSLTEAITF